jgi:hypothetical protein
MVVALVNVDFEFKKAKGWVGLELQGMLVRLWCGSINRGMLHAG